MMNMYSGIVEDRHDPFELGRYRVRVFGLHSHDKAEIPTEALPWANVLQPATSAAINGVGQTPKLVVGTNVIVTFFDESLQNPLIIGSIAGVGTHSHLVFNGQAVPNDNDQYGFTSASDSDYVGQSDVSKAARSGKTENLRSHVQVNNIAGAFEEPNDLRPYRQYPYSQARQSESGHLEEWDDTPGNERIATQHRTGTFTEMRPDGDHVTKIVKDNYTIVAGDNNLYVSGAVNVLVEGDVNFTTEGDFNLNVGGDYNVRVQGNLFEHTNEDKTVVVNGNESSYIVNDSTQSVGGDYESTIVGNVTEGVYGSATYSTYGDVNTTILGLFNKSVTGNSSYSTKSNASSLATGTMELGAKSAAYLRGSTVDLNDTTATAVEFEDLDTEDQITIYDQDFESIEADISTDTTSVTIKSSQAGIFDSEEYITGLRNASTVNTPYTTILNGKGESVRKPTVEKFDGGRIIFSNYSKVQYYYSNGTKRDGTVSDSLESILSKSAFAADIYMVEIYSGKQPGTKGRRVGSGRHDTGEAVDIRLIKTEEDYHNPKGRVYVNGTTSEGQSIIRAFLKAAVPLGIRGGGFSPSYMGNYGMHLDTLGQIINTSNSRSISGYDRNVLAAWKSDYWFREAMFTADPSYKYYIALASGTRYYSKTNSKWNTI